MEITRRYRINVGTSVKGIKTFDCTVEVTATGDGIPETIMDDTLTESDRLVKELDSRYPAIIEEKKEK